MWIKKFAIQWISFTSIGLFVVEVISTDLPIFKCIETKHGKCYFDDIGLNETHPYYKPVLESYNKLTTNGDI